MNGNQLSDSELNVGTNKDNASKHFTFCYFIFGILFSLVLLAQYNFLLFHTIAELISIVVAWSFFTFVWNLKQYIRNDAFIFIGISYFFIGLIDLVHTLSYKGMMAFGSAEFSTQLWIAARYMESLSLFFLPLLINRCINVNIILSIFLTIVIVIFLSIFHFNTFPTCYHEGYGTTNFKKYSEYLICCILAASMFLLNRQKKAFDHTAYNLMILSIILTILSEITFTFYVDVYDCFNLIGHFLKILSFILIYQAIIEICIKKPNELLFRDLQQSNIRLKLKNRIATQITSDMSAERVIQQTVKEISLYFPCYRMAYSTLDFSGKLTVIDSIEPENMPELKGFEADLSIAPGYQKALIEKQVLIVEDILQNKLFDSLRESTFFEKTRALINVPITQSNQLTGILCFDAPEPHQWKNHEIETLKEISAYLSIVFKNASSEKKLNIYETIVQNSTDLMSFIDTNYRYQIVNKCYQDFFKRNPDDLIGQTPAELLGQESFDTVFKPLFDKCLTGETLDYQGWFEKPEDSKRFLDVKYNPVVNRKSNVIGIVFCARDITDLIKTQEALNLERKRLNMVLETVPGFIYLQAPDYTIRYANEYFQKTFGDPTERLCYEIIHGRKEPCEHCETLDVLNSQQKTIWEWTNGNKIYSIYDFPFVDTDGSDLVLEIGIDITKQKETEIALIQEKARAESATIAKSEFIANMSHEIRTPMNAIIAFSQILKDKSLGFLNNQQIKYLDNILESSNRLLCLINDILDLSRIESGKIEISNFPFNSEKLMKRIEQTISSLARNKDLTTEAIISTDVPKFLIGDENRIEQVLKNLISNAVKFTDQGHIRVSLEKNESNELIFMVSDTGIGISKEQLQHLFDRFYQADSSYSKKYAGAGLGLAISKELVELMEGKIWAESELGKGSVFYFKLKLEISDAEHFNPQKEKTKKIGKIVDNKPLKILLAEDDDMNRESMTFFLKQKGHLISQATNGREVLNCLEKEAFDIILMDIQMPEMDGIETTQRIRSDTSHKFDPTIPIIALTAYAMNGDKEQFLQKGMNAFVSKPIDFDLLMDTIHLLMLSTPSEKKIQHNIRQNLSDNIIEIESFIAEVSDHPDFAQSMLSGFLQEAENRKKLLFNAFVNKDFKLLATIAHKMTNLFSSVQLIRLGKVSKELERDALDSNLERSKQHIDDLSNGLNEVETYIRGHQLYAKK